jgi:hypothetical protein
MNKYHEENRLSWNEATLAHNSHKGGQAKFFREGGNKLYSEEKKNTLIAMASSHLTRCMSLSGAGICQKEHPIYH